MGDIFNVAFQIRSSLSIQKLLCTIIWNRVETIKQKHYVITLISHSIKTLIVHILHLPYPEVGEVVWAPLKTLQPILALYLPPCPLQLSWAHQCLGLSILGCCPPISFSVWLSPSVPALCLVRLSRHHFDLTIHAHTTSVAFSLRSGGHQKARWIVKGPQKSQTAQICIFTDPE